MKRSAICVVASASALLGTAVGWAQEEKPPSNYEHLKDAEFIIGTWESKGTYPEGDDLAGQDYVFRVVQRWILKKNAIAVHLSSKVAEQTLSARVMIGWDSSKKKIVSCGFSSLGVHGTGVMEIEPNRMQLRETGFQADGTPVSYMVELTRKDENTLVRKVTERMKGDKELPDIEDVLRRVKQD